MAKEPIKRGTYEAYAGVGIALVLGLFPMSFVLKCALSAALVGILAHLILRSHWTNTRHWAIKSLLGIVVASLVTAALWKPLADQYAIDYRTVAARTAPQLALKSDRITDPAQAPSVVAPPITRPVASNKGIRFQDAQRPKFSVDDSGAVPQHLVRSLALDQFTPVLENSSAVTVLSGMSGRVNNAGLDTIYWHIESSHIYLLKQEIYNAAGNSWTYLSPNQGVSINSVIPTPVAIPQEAGSLVLDLTIKYDTAPPTGIRISYRKIQYDLLWNNGHATVTNSHTLDQEER